MKHLIEKIKDKDWQSILHYCQALSEEQRYNVIEYLKAADTRRDLFETRDDKLTDEERKAFYDNQHKVLRCYYFALVACTRNYADIKKTEYKDTSWVVNPLKELLWISDNTPLEAFFTKYPPDYLDRIVREVAKEKFSIIDFKTLWNFYEHSWISFDEASFMKSLFTIRMFHRDTRMEADYLFNNSSVFNEVFLRFYRNEIPVLDISKWESREGFVCKKVYEYWTEVIILLQEKGVTFERSIIENLLESLLNNWKKGHLDWHTRLLDLFHPTLGEMLQYQHLLFSLFGTNNPSLINFSIKHIKTISRSKEFDGNAFIENFALCFSNEKCIKSITEGLAIVEEVLSKPEYRNAEFSEKLAVLLMHADVKLQLKVAALLLRFTEAKQLGIIIAPYAAYLKQQTKQQLSVADETKTEKEEEQGTITEKVFPEVVIPSTWDELLFQIGSCIHSKSATEIDILLEGINQLQNIIPADLEKQLKPYTKQLFGRPWDFDVVAYLTLFLDGWINNTEIVEDESRTSPIPFLRSKCNNLIRKLREKNDLPFLSTPTHLPFYIHPTALVKRILLYEEKKAEIFYEDLIVACNRTWFKKADQETKMLAKKMNGRYASALLYYLGVSDKIEVTEDMLVLWAQVTRIKDPDAIFSEFENTMVSLYPSVVRPLMIDFRVQIDSNPHVTWCKLLLEGNWNRAWYDDYNLYNKQLGEHKAVSYDHIYYNISSLKKASRVDIPYQLSLNPNYLDGQISRYIPRLASGNEVAGFEDCLYPMKFVLDNELEIHHSGWIYVAACLVFEKKISRELAGEYIKLALVQQHKKLDYLADTVGRLVAQKFGPVNRLLEFFDHPNTQREVVVFQHQVLEKCIEHFDMLQLPTNSKKIFEYYSEWSQRSGIAENATLISKVKSIKKK